MGSVFALHQQGILTDLDLHFARLMCRLAEDESEELALGAALVSHWTANGHVCLDLSTLAGSCLKEGDLPVTAPPLEPWCEALERSPVVGTPGEYRPLVLDAAHRLYLYRYWNYERILGEALKGRGEELAVGVDETSLADGLRKLFPESQEKRVDWQKLAAATAVLRRFCVISGGPGTGKTSTVVRILALLRLQPGGEALKVALAAPTGKAAARLQEAISAAKRNLPLDDALARSIPEQAATLHRLLGVIPDSIHFRHNRENPLPVDLLVLDEASMIDMALMAKLVQALPQSARLVLLGDRDQLASVEAGSVLGELCGDVPGFSEKFRKRLQRLTGENIPPEERRVPSFADSVVLLRHSYRFSGDSGIGRLAVAVNSGDGAGVLSLLGNDGAADVARISPDKVTALAVKAYRSYLTAIRAGAEAAEVFQAFNRFRLLCALRGGDAGVRTLNEAVEGRLHSEGLINAAGVNYAGRPVLITRNDHDLRLYNGDVGILLPDKESGGCLRACFLAEGGAVRKILPARLPEHETVFAMTVHKSQGSEFEEVLLVLPEKDLPLLSRELLYTGITRARQRILVSAPDQTLLSVVGRRLQRTSGLRDVLRNL